MIYKNNEVLEKDKKRRRKALIFAFFITSSIVLSLYLVPFYWAKAKIQDFEYGMAVSYGQDEFGSDAGEEIPIEEVLTEEEVSEEVTDETENTETSTNNESTPIDKKEESKTKNKQKNKNKDKNKKQQSVKDKNKKTGQGKGNDKDKKGDKGKENGVDERGLYDGKGGTGLNANIAGWRWEIKPDLKDIPSKETGKITFKVAVEGGIISRIQAIKPTTVSTTTVNLYKDKIYNEASFTKTRGDIDPNKEYKGTITVIIKAK